MFGWAATFLTAAIVGGVFGFAGPAGATAWIAKALFLGALVALVILLLRGRTPPAA